MLSLSRSFKPEVTVKEHHTWKSHLQYFAYEVMGRLKSKAASDPERFTTKGLEAMRKKALEGANRA